MALKDYTNLYKLFVHLRILQSRGPVYYTILFFSFFLSSSILHGTERILVKKIKLFFKDWPQSKFEYGVLMYGIEKPSECQEDFDIDVSYYIQDVLSLIYSFRNIICVQPRNSPSNSRYTKYLSKYIYKLI